MSARRRRRTAPTAPEPDEPERVRHVHGPLAALLDPPVTRYSSNTPTPNPATPTEEDPR